MPLASVAYDVGGTIPGSAIHHYDATALGLSDGGSVSTWADQIGSRDLTGNATYNTGGDIDPRVETDGVDDELDNSTTTTFRERTLFFVIRTDATSDHMWTYQESTGGGFISIRDGAHIYQEVSDSTSVQIGFNTSLSTASIISVRYEDTGSAIDVTVRQNGSVTGTDTISSSASFENIYPIFGGDNDGRETNTEFGEYVETSDALTDNAISDEEERLGDKWGIAI